MSGRIDPMEKLAREICWAGFVHPGAREGKSKAKYWKAISESAREGYRLEARQFAYLLERIDCEVLNDVHLRHLTSRTEENLDDICAACGAARREHIPGGTR